MAFVQGVANHINGTGNAAITALIAGAQTSGNTNLVFVSISASAVISSVTDTKGNSYKVLSSPGAEMIAVYAASNIAAAGAGTNTVTVNFSVNCDFPDVHVLEYSGIEASLPLDGVSAGSGTGTSISSGTFSTTRAYDTVAAFVTSPSAPTISAGTGFTMRVNESPGWAVASADMSTQVVGSYAGLFTFSSSLAWNCKAVGLKTTTRLIILDGTGVHSAQ
jgi:hypothetical protein